MLTIQLKHGFVVDGVRVDTLQVGPLRVRHYLALERRRHAIALLPEQQQREAEFLSNLETLAARIENFGSDQFAPAWLQELSLEDLELVLAEVEQQDQPSFRGGPGAADAHGDPGAGPRDGLEPARAGGAAHG